MLACLALAFLASVEAAPGQSAAPECREMRSSGQTFCRSGNRWILHKAPSATPKALTVGDNFPVYDQSMLMELRRYGLPPVDGPWRYYLRDGVIYKVSAATQRVIAVVGPAKSR